MLMIIVYLIPIDSAVIRLSSISLAYLALLLTVISGVEYVWQNRHILKNA
jgi:CDP-diacylglycerol--glycerol-3-phosphate 3-phosphatidyltransferase